ncbi:RHS repeat-associated core domain-containing protein [Sphingomonas koreensis]
MQHLLCGSVLAAGLLPAAASAQATPPVRRSIDENGVDVIRGSFNLEQPGVSIGGTAPHGLLYNLQSIGGNWRSSSASTIDKSGDVITVTVDGRSDDFEDNFGSYIPIQGRGSRLTKSGAFYIYTSTDGDVVRFNENPGDYYYENYQASLGFVADITTASGIKTSFSYFMAQYCPPGFESGECPGGLKYAIRLASQTNSNGYALKFSYSDNSSSIDSATYQSWSRPANVRAINRAECNLYDVCADSSSWPSMSYARTQDGSGNVTETVTDSLSQTTTYYGPVGPSPTFTITRPGSVSPNIAVSYDTSGQVSAVTRDGVTNSYGYSYSGTTMTTTATDANGGQRVYVGDYLTNLLASYRDEMLRLTSYQYDSNGRVTRVTAHDSSYTSYTYDARGNVTEVRQVAKPGSGLADIVTSATFVSTCLDPKTCNKPVTTTDARGNTTDYTYDSSHGGVLTVTQPAATTGAVRPQTRYGYSGVQAYFKDVTGAVVASGTSTQLLTSVSACRTTASCAGGSDEVKGMVDYGPQTSGTANNLLPVSNSLGSGDGALTATTAMTYDNIGNQVTTDGPLSGTADVTRTRYDAGRRVVGVAGPDPDGGGALKHRAQRFTYNPSNQITMVETGTVDSQSDTDWAAFNSLQQVTSTYDSNARKTKDVLTAASTTHQVQQYGYDSQGRLDCSTTRMNSAAWSSLPAACTLGTAGTAGPDRIVKNSYNAASEVTKVQSGYGVSGVQADDVTTTYTATGQVESVTDAEGNKTTYEYDGHDRLVKTRFPSTTQGSGTSSTTDYEEVGYDAASNVTSQRLRDGQSVGLSYDNLSRLTGKDLPGSNPDTTLSYDLLGQMTGMTRSDGQVLSFGYDALGRNISAGANPGTLTYQYDLAGRRTRITHPDSFYAQYDYLVTGEVSAIRENGATSGAGVLATFAYDAQGRRTSLTRGNGNVTSYGHDAVSRLTSLGHDIGGTTHDVNFGFTHDPASGIATRTRDNDTYAFPGFANVNQNDTLNGLNQVTATGSTSLTHDARGNITAVGSSGYSFDVENRMTAGGLFSAIKYDPLGRLQQVVNTIPRGFMWDANDLVLEYNENDQIQRRYVHGPGMDEPLVWYGGSGTSDRRWLHADERGSIVGLSNAAGSSLSVSRYDEYGVPASGNGGRFGYTGQIWMPEMGMYYYKARFYNPALGRFMQADPIGYGDGLNLYAYVGGDPVNGVDPMGLREYKPTWIDDIGKVLPPEVVITRSSDNLPPGAVYYKPPSAPGAYDGEVIIVNERPKSKIKEVAQKICGGFIDSGGSVSPTDLAGLAGSLTGGLVGKFVGDRVGDAVVSRTTRFGRMLGNSSDVVGAGARGAVRGARAGRALGYVGTAAGIVTGWIYRNEIDSAIKKVKSGICGGTSK